MTTLDDHALVHQLTQLAHWQSYERVVRERMDGEIQSTIASPELNDADVTRDLRYRLGFAAGLQWALARPSESLAILNEVQRR